VELLLDWARQDIFSAIRVNNIGTSELIRSLIETSSIIRAPCHHQPMKISKQNILTSLRLHLLDAMAMYLLCRSLTTPWTSRSMFNETIMPAIKAVITCCSTSDIIWLEISYLR
jgi:hypothetical protein